MSENRQPLNEYFAALERLKSGGARHVARGARITNDAVSIEAGRAKGSIKRSRAVFADLIRTIDEAASEQASPKNHENAKRLKEKGRIDELRTQLEAALAREVSLLKELFDTRKQLSTLTGEKVLPIRGRPFFKKPDGQKEI
ncbi:hypothetical protein BTHE68_62250 (plasmid) [Burkholderia sp. THE68]|uniref:hypothetical protein n=1 Tax=Burkholderia sp. THE68 TaxID=758782 RepID=UPI001318E78F|nr:hypothetical protein [Burkholderia sp. THE68]BBU32491.1 hypothetical protein BTHE68_62250 [Burkholderia sp. THE68]